MFRLISVGKRVLKKKKKKPVGRVVLWLGVCKYRLTPSGFGQVITCWVKKQNPRGSRGGWHCRQGDADGCDTRVPVTGGSRGADTAVIAAVGRPIRRDSATVQSVVGSQRATLSSLVSSRLVYKIVIVPSSFSRVYRPERIRPKRKKKKKHSEKRTAYRHLDITPIDICTRGFRLSSKNRTGWNYLTYFFCLVDFEFSKKKKKKIRHITRGLSGGITEEGAPSQF